MSYQRQMPSTPFHPSAKIIIKNSKKVSSQQEQYQDTQKTFPDAFSKYSNNIIHLKTLLLKEEDKEFDTDNFVRKHCITRKVNIKGRVVARAVSASNHQQEEVNSSNEPDPQDGACTHKTRIMFEVYPSLILDGTFFKLHDPNAKGTDALG